MRYVFHLRISIDIFWLVLDCSNPHVLNTFKMEMQDIRMCFLIRKHLRQKLQTSPTGEDTLFHPILMIYPQSKTTPQKMMIV